MNKLEIFLACVEREYHLFRGWPLLLFNVAAPNQSFPRMGLEITDKGVFKFTLDDVVHELTPEKGKPLFGTNEKVKLPKGSLKCIHKDIESTYGLLLCNSVIIESSYEGAVEYLNSRFTDSGKINKVAYEALNSGKVTVEQHMRFENAVTHIEAYNTIQTPSGSRKAMTPNAKVVKLRDELLIKHKHELADPIVISGIQDQLIALDRKELEGDPAQRFLLKAKNYKVARLQLLGMFGADADFYDDTQIVAMYSSLSEGWGKDEIVQMANNIRSGALSRGEETALGGVQVKNTSRAFQNYLVKGNDCGTKKGYRMKFTKNDVGEYVGRYLIGSNKPLTAVDEKGLVGKYIHLRSPGGCMNKGDRICIKCIGDSVESTKVGLNILCNVATGSFVSLFLAKVHANGLETERLDWKDCIS